MDVNDLIHREEFFYADCVAINHLTIIGCEIKDGLIKINDNILIDESDLTGIFQNFYVEVDGSVYTGGEASGHGSCGFFYKKTNDSLNWALMSLESNPFIGVDVCKGSVRFLSDSGSVWVVPDDDITKVYIEK